MTLDEIERKAASILTEQWHGQDTVELAELLLLVMPVVRVGERLMPHPPPAIQYLAMDRTDWGCAVCVPDGDMVLARRNRGEPDFVCAPHALIQAIDTMRRGLGKPITEAEVKQALAQGRIERKIAEGDHAWRSLVDRNEALTQQLSATTAARDAAVAWLMETVAPSIEAERRIAALRKVGAP